jgi:hypothetical protein
MNHAKSYHCDESVRDEVALFSAKVLFQNLHIPDALVVIDYSLDFSFFPIGQQ